MTPIKSNEKRLARLQAWVTQQLGSPGELIPLLGDAGGRRYFQLSQSQNWLAVDAPPETEKVAQFVYMAEQLRLQRVRVPHLKAVDVDKGFLLVENLGLNLLADDISQDTAPLLYGEALMTLLAMAQTPLQALKVPVYDRDFILRELEIFREWFLAQLLGIELAAADNRLLDQLFDTLAQHALAQPQVLMHRDYHARNIILAQGQCAVIDFQDAVVGPLTYDAVSLLKDAYLRLPADDVKRWAQVYGDMARDSGLLTTAQCASFWQDFELMGLQRHLKILGIFARLDLRDGKPGYLPDLPRVLGYVLETCAAHRGQLGEFEVWLHNRVLPQCQRHSWYIEETMLQAHYVQPATQVGATVS
ncbi:aminoglycoside phosphotransferase family protein [Gilvimarinus xylanilyticus]|uniref:Phosphotransferase n=1 Tax=Gilvimarinus xylanilyticus TaxID=2944139 RepID=A0A9X2HYE5_9GAMM|nr:phosphotransferase [Gilvimarinus xylanilyticus]